MDLSTLVAKQKLYLKANKAYNDGGKPIMTDAEFDRLEQQLMKACPDWEPLNKTGSKVNKKVSVPLFEPMPSLGKCYPENIDKWLAKQKAKRLLLTHKLDGSALQGLYRNGRCVFLATRGDGEIGKDISFLIPKLKHSLPIIADKAEVVLRFEAVMSNEKFKKWQRKSKDDKEGFDNPRNTVNGLLNRREPHPAMRDIDIIVLGVYGKPYLKGLEWADDQGFKVVSYDSVAITVKVDFAKLLAKARSQSIYDIDGLVLVPPEQVFAYDSYDKPKWTTAFKVNHEDDAIDAVVKDIIWQESKIGRWTPKVELEPINLKGVTITYATAHNAEWMHERRIGKGAVVKIVRSGDVIPKIVDVSREAKKLSYPPGDYERRGVHFYNVAESKSKEANVREIHHFMAVLGIEHLAQKSIAKLYDKGFTSVLDHLNAMVPSVRLMRGYQDAGIGQAMTTKIYEEFHRVLRFEGVTLLQLMNASNCFESFGERKLQMIEQHFMKQGDPDPLRGYVKLTTRRQSLKDHAGPTLADIKGFGEASITQFFEGLIRFKEWFRPLAAAKIIKINPPQLIQKKKIVKGDLAGQKVSFTGYRDKSHEAEVEARGAEVVPYSSKTTILLYKKGGKASSKIEAARAKGLRVCTFEEL